MQCEGVWAEPERHRLRAGLTRLVLGIDCNVPIGNKPVDGPLDRSVLADGRLSSGRRNRDRRAAVAQRDVLLIRLNYERETLLQYARFRGAGGQKRARECKERSAKPGTCLVINGRRAMGPSEIRRARQKASHQWCMA